MSDKLVCNYAPTGATAVGMTCERTPVGTITVACIHEHFTEANGCTKHLPEIVAVVERGNAQCGACRRARCVPCTVRLIDQRDLVLSTPEGN